MRFRLVFGRSASFGTQPVTWVGGVRLSLQNDPPCPALPEARRDRLGLAAEVLTFLVAISEDVSRHVPGPRVGRFAHRATEGVFRDAHRLHPVP